MSNCLIRFPLQFRYLQGIATATRTDVTDLCEIDQLCSGLKGGAFHAMKEICDENSTSAWGLYLLIPKMHLIL